MYIHFFTILIYLSTKANAVYLIYAKFGCSPDYSLSAKYLVKLEMSTIQNTRYEVQTCKPSVENNYCHYDISIWRQQSCRSYYFRHQRFYINCNVTNPYKGERDLFNTFGVRLTVEDTLHQEKLTKVTPVTPLMLCEPDSEEKMIQA